MAPENLKRKLTAILSADVKGYSRLMGEDEEGTIRILNAYMGVITGFIQQHRGRVIATGGDSVLAEFASVVDAVRCAVGIQEELKDRNKDLTEGRRMEFRIGVNLGDVVEEGDNILGDGVNVAARVQSLAEAGGISISGTAYDQIKNKLTLGYDFLGEQTVKNIKEPVRVYRVRMDPEAAASQVIEGKKPVRKRLSRAVLTGIALLVIAGAVVLYQVAIRPSASKTEVASKEKMAFTLPDQPSIAVLPFVNLSEDPKQEFFIDGVTESIITALSKSAGLFVISRNSTSTYKGKSVKVKQVSEELGVQYVLEGSVQKSGDRVRITAQLIDALTGHHLWAERYERNLKEIFALQDEITIKIATSLRVKLTEGDQAFGWEKYFRGKQGLDCYVKHMEALNYWNLGTIEGKNEARRLGEEIVAMCPENPMGYLALGWVNAVDVTDGSTKSPRESIVKAMELAKKVQAMDDSLSMGHSLLGFIYSMIREHDKAIAEGERAVALEPNGSWANQFLGLSLVWAGRPEEAIPLLQKAIRLNPFCKYETFQFFGIALKNTGRFEEAVSAFKQALQRSPNNMWNHIHLAATYSLMGREKEAREEAAEILRINPKFTLNGMVNQYKDQTIGEKFIINPLRQAGLK